MQVSKFIRGVETPLTQLSDGSHFGEMGLISKALCNANVLAITHCDLQMLSQESFESLQRQFAEFRAAVCSSTKDRAKSAAQKSREADGVLQSSAESKQRGGSIVRGSAG